MPRASAEYSPKERTPTASIDTLDVTGTILPAKVDATKRL